VVEVDHPCWSARIRLRRANTTASPACWCRWTPRASRCGRSRTCRAARCSRRCSSTTCGCRRRTARRKKGRAGTVTVSALAPRSGRRSPRWKGLRRKLEELKELARKSRRTGGLRSEDDGIRRRIARFEAKIEGMRFNGMRALTKQLKGEPLGAEDLDQQATARGNSKWRSGEIALEMQGSAGHLEREVDGGRWQRFALSWPEVVIGGGTPNIQKNIIAERVLGLRRTDDTEDRVRRIEALLARKPRSDRRAGRGREPQAPRSRRRRRRRRPLPRQHRVAALRRALGSSSRNASSTRPSAT